MRERLTTARLAQAAFCLLLVLASAHTAGAEPVQTVVNNGDPANRVDLVLLGDGYTAAQMSKYAADVQQFMQVMFQQEPFREYQRYFNVHRIDVASAESGADHPEISVFRNTAFDAAYNCAGIQRLICANLARVETVVANSLAPAQRDLVILIVNDAEYGGSGGAISIAAAHPEAVELILHESGHTFGLLADEYETNPPACVNTVEPAQPNVTRATERSAVKWNAWIDPATPIPTGGTTPALPGLYLGAKYCTSGLYRPTYASKMRVLGRPYEQINSEQLIRRIYNRVSPVDSAAPAAGAVTLAPTQSQTFTVKTPSPMTHGLGVSWSIDGRPAGTGPSLTVAAGALGVGAHAVEARVTDQTAMVRRDAEQLLSESVRWSVTVASANPIDATDFFVRQQYLDFLGREPDAAGLQFWSRGVESCGADARCRQFKRVDTSAAFFLAIEFQETGYLAYKARKAAFGNLPGKPVPLTRAEMVADAGQIGAGVAVGVGDWAVRLEQNKVAYFNALAASSRFVALYPASMTAEAFVDALNAKAGGALSASERRGLVDALKGGTRTRAQALRAVAEDSDLHRAETNRAFVLMQYFGYLRRNPDDVGFDGRPDPAFNGFNFWLTKLNAFNGDFRAAEMVRAFIESIEYRQRFGQ